MPSDLAISMRSMKFIVSDLDRVTLFYQQALGFELERRIELGEVTENVLRLPGSAVALVLLCRSGEAVTAGTSYGPLSFETRDVKAVVDALVAAGGTLTMGPLELPTVSMAMVNDPEGHALQILHIPTGEIDYDSLKPKKLALDEG